MHGVDKDSMTGANSTQMVNGSTTTSAPTQVDSSLTAAKVVNSVSTTSVSGGNITLCQQPGTIINIMSRPGAIAAGTPNGTPVTLPVQPGMQIVNMRPGQNTQITGGRGLTPRMIVNQIPNVRPGQTGQQLTLQSLSSLPPGTQGHLIVKTDNGQLQLLRVNAAPPTGQIPSHTTPTGNAMVVHQAPTTTYRLQQPQTSGTIVSLTNNASQVATAAGGPTVVVPASAVTVAASSATAVTTSATAVSTAASVQSTPAVGTQTISAESAKTKCKNFLATLLRLASEQRAKVAQNVRNLIQGLIDGQVEPEAFTEELQKDLNSSPQPCLVPFLKKTLPYLRTSLAKGELAIDGVRPPPLSAVVPVTGMTTVIPSMVNVARPANPPSAPGLRVVNPTPTATPAVIHRPVANSSTVNHARVVTGVQQVRLGNKNVVAAATAKSTQPSSMASSSSPTTTQSSSTPTSKQASKSSSKEDKKSSKDKSASYNSVADDDINDVAAMGGVNLGEESQRILDSTGFVGTQIRSCKDEVFLASSPLHAKIRQITSEHNLDDPSKEIVSLVSHAVQERLKTIIEKLGVIAEHRLEVARTEPRYEVTQDVKGQLRFLEDLDRLEKKRKDEYEREILLRAAKSRSKSEDPEQVKLKAKAKEMQRVELEEMRQRDANLTALKALQGPRKKAKLDASSEEGSFSGTFTQKQMPLRPRVKRVNLRDFLFLMEQEKDLRASPLLFKSYFK